MVEKPKGRTSPTNLEALEAPIFLVGCVRSGTTLLGLMLSNHPDIAFPGEFELSVDRIEEDGSLPDLVDYHDWLHTHRHFLWHELEIDPSLGYGELVHSFLAKMKLENSGGPKGYVGVAVHWNFEHLPTLWPKARFIHLLRDPRDVCASIKVMGWASNHYAGARTWRKTEESWDRLRRQVPAESRLEIAFEDLTQDPQRTLTQICEFIGVPYSIRMMSYPDHSTYERVDSNVGQRWRRNQARRDVQLGEAGAGVLLEQRGYERSGHPPLTIGPIYRRLLEFHSRFGALRFRIKRYGFGLWLERRVSQTLGIKSWYQRARLREHEIKNRNLK